MYKRSYLALLVTVLFSFFLFILPPRVGAQINTTERITDFKSVVDIGPDSSLNVTESITVYANGEQIKRGIYRDFPTQYGGLLGSSKGFKVVSVTKDDVQEPYRIEDQINGKRVYVGNSTILIPQGTYTYKITYETTNQIGFFKDHDELYWNVTGNGWNFPIEQSSAEIHLPGTAPVQQTIGYIGFKNSKEQSVIFNTSQQNNHTVVMAQSQRPLASTEGMTVVVTWPKGYVTEPPWYTAFLPQNLGLDILVALGLPITLFIFYYFLWRKIGRDRTTSGPAVVQTQPPDGLTPAAVRFVNNMGVFDNTFLSTTFIHLAVQGYIQIKNDNGSYAVSKTTKDASELINEERILYDGMFAIKSNSKEVLSETIPKNSTTSKVQGSGFFAQQTAKVANLFSREEDTPNTFVIRRTNWRKLQKITLSTMEYFNTISKKLVVSNRVNLLYALIPLGMFGAYHVVTAFTQHAETKLFFMAFATFWNVIVSFFVLLCIANWTSFLATRNWTLFFPAIFLTFFLLPFVGVGIFTGIMAFGLAGYIGIFASIVILLSFYKALPRRTPQAVELQNRIDGFKVFLKSQERYVQGVKMDLPTRFSMYERYLPFAIALGIETQWSAQFKQTFAQMAEAGMQTTPIWYSGSDSFTTFSSQSFSSSLTSSISSASVNPTSSSGTSGGSSGGGGGGGGGGGW
ncbi:MAG: DUF2207 domain-containing protein [Candidatus Roizmanbacteria bacterium]|nr:DUF2207 domain-containing protein [Candidatus Roizmanbacteria bacterium]